MKNNFSPSAHRSATLFILKSFSFLNSFLLSFLCPAKIFSFFHKNVLCIFEHLSLHVYYCVDLIVPPQEDFKNATPARSRTIRSWCHLDPIKNIYNSSFFTLSHTLKTPSDLFSDFSSSTFEDQYPKKFMMSSIASKKRKTSEKEKKKRDIERRNNADLIMNFSHSSWKEIKDDPSLYRFSVDPPQKKLTMIENKDDKTVVIPVSSVVNKDPIPVSSVVNKDPVVDSSVDNNVPIPQEVTDGASSSARPEEHRAEVSVQIQPPDNTVHVPDSLKRKLRQLGHQFAPLMPNKLDFGDNKPVEAMLDDDKIIALSVSILEKRDVTELAYIIKSLAGAMHCVHAPGEAADCGLCKFNVNILNHNSIMRAGTMMSHLLYFLLVFCGLFAGTNEYSLSADPQPMVIVEAITDQNVQDQLVEVDNTGPQVSPMDLTYEQRIEVNVDNPGLGVKHMMAVEPGHGMVSSKSQSCAPGGCFHGTTAPSSRAWTGSTPSGAGGQQPGPAQGTGPLQVKTWYPPAGGDPVAPAYGRHSHYAPHHGVYLDPRDKGAAMGQAPLPPVRPPGLQHSLAGQARLPGIAPPAYGAHHLGLVTIPGMMFAPDTKAATAVAVPRTSMPGSSSASTPRASRASSSSSQPRFQDNPLAPPSYNYFGAPADSSGSPWLVVLVTGIDRNPSRHPYLYTGHLESERICSDAVRAHDTKSSAQNMPSLSVPSLGLIRSALPYIGPLMPISPYTCWDLRRALPVIKGSSQVYAAFGNQADNTIVSPATVSREGRLIFINGYRCTPFHPTEWLDFNFRVILNYGRYLRFFMEKQSWTTVPPYVKDAQEAQLQACVCFASLDLFSKQAIRLLELHRVPPTILTVGDVIRGIFPLRGEFAAPAVWSHPLAPGVPHE